jgi:transcription initiation factor TFIIH subunit 2
MTDSDYDYEEDASDDEYIGSKSATGPRTQVPERKRKTQNKTPKAWERRRESEANEAEVEYDFDLSGDEVEDQAIIQSVQEREEERKRKR